MGLIKTPDEIKKMRDVCRVTAMILEKLISNTEPGDTGMDINRRAVALFNEAGIEPAFKGLYGFPAVLCISVNEYLIHGIPNGVPFKSGDVVKYDIGARLDGFCSDTARTFIVGSGGKEASHVRLIEGTREALAAGIREVKPGATLYDIAAAVEAVAKDRRYGNVSRFHGHGIGRQVHEEPAVHNCTAFASRMVLKPGMTLAIEPMFVLGDADVEVDRKDPWVVRAVDRSIGAHFEDTVLVTEDGHEILTR